MVRLMLSFVAAVTLAAQTADAPGRGISEALARERAVAIQDLRYDLTFVVPRSASEAVQGRAVVRFRLDAPQRIVLDFAQPLERVRSVAIGGRPVDFNSVNGPLVIPAPATVAGAHEVAIEFEAGDEALNRNDVFLDTLFVPARAPLAVPCFDQPDL
jgi:aminopeptidase N